jgi:hypothetical protein
MSSLEPYFDDEFVRDIGSAFLRLVCAQVALGHVNPALSLDYMDLAHVPVGNGAERLVADVLATCVPGESGKLPLARVESWIREGAGARLASALTDPEAAGRIG